jgi:hypothetical protein
MTNTSQIARRAALRLPRDRHRLRTGRAATFAHVHNDKAIRQAKACTRRCRIPTHLHPCVDKLEQCSGYSAGRMFADLSLPFDGGVNPVRAKELLLQAKRCEWD